MDLSQDTLNELRNNIRGSGAREAFDILVDHFRGLEALEVGVGKHGFITDVRVVTDIGNCFAFIANQHWLLCYFRAPAISAGKFSEAEIKKRFPASQPAGKEWKLRVASREDAIAVAPVRQRGFGATFKVKPFA